MDEKTDHTGARTRSCDSALPAEALSCAERLLYARCHGQPSTFITLFNPHQKSWAWKLLLPPVYTQTGAQTPDYISQPPLRLEKATAQVQPTRWEFKGDIRPPGCPIKASHISSSMLLSPSYGVKGNDPVNDLERPILKTAKPLGP